MPWLILTFLAVISRSFYSLATRLLSTHVKVSAISQSVLFTGFASCISLCLSPFLGGISLAHFSSVWGIAVVTIVSAAMGNIIFFKGQEALDAGTTQIAFSSIVIWAALLSTVFLGSHFSFLQILGIGTLLFAILIIQYRKGGYRFSSAVWYICASAACFAIFQVTSAQLSQTLRAGTYLPLVYIGSTFIVSLLYWEKIKSDYSVVRKNLSNVFQKGFFASSTSLLYFLFSYLAYAAAPDRGIVVLLLITQVIVSVFLGIIFLKEYQGIKRKVFAGVLAVIASILIKA